MHLTHVGPVCRRLTLVEWQQVTPSVLAVCSCQAGAAWLGQYPEELQSQALQVVCRLQRGMWLGQMMIMTASMQHAMKCAALEILWV